MIEIKEKKDCCGCNACVDACRAEAITLATDNEGFWYPKIDSSKCTGCGLCNKVCPIINVDNLKKNEFEVPVCFASTHKSIETRFASTTGGIFSALAEQMYKEGGYVGGAIYDEQFVVRHFISNNPDDLARLRQSKYSQSQTVGIYREVLRLLQAGEKVLICGTPCQMAGLRSFLRRDYENLIIVDFICKSITSPKFYAKYLDYWERKAGSRLSSFKFKDKELGWRQLVKRFDFQNGKTFYSRASDNDLYSSAYHHNIVSRPSCYDCKFKGFPRISDITIADFWGVEKFSDLKALDDNAGTSAVIINNSRGLAFYEKIKKSVNSLSANIKQIIPGNPALMDVQSAPSCDRKEFFETLDKHPIEEVVPKFTTYFGQDEVTLKSRLKMLLGIMKRVKECTQMRPAALWRFVKYNFLSSEVKTDWRNMGLIFPTPYAIVELQKGSKLELHGPFVVGAKKLRKSTVETRLLLEKNATMYVRKRFTLFYGSDVEVFHDAVLDIEECGTNYNCTIICGKKIEMRGHVSIGRDVCIRDTNAHIIAMDGYKVMRPVVIENHTWLCSGATICPGVKIKEGAVVGAQSYVIQNVPAHTLVSGHPAVIVKKNIAWKL